MRRIRLEMRQAGGFAIFEINENGSGVRCLDSGIIPDRYNRVDLTHILRSYKDFFGEVVYEIFMKCPHIKGYRFDTKFVQNSVGKGTNVPVPIVKGGITENGIFIMDFKR